MNGAPTPDGLPRILLFHGFGFVSWATRVQTRSHFSHAAVLLPDGKTIIEAWQGTNMVQRKVITDWSNVYQYRVPSLTPEGAQRGMDFLNRAVREKWEYDYRGPARFLTRRMHEFKDGSAFCSALVHEYFRLSGVQLLRMNSGLVAPAHLDISPLVEFEPRPFV